MCFFGLLLALQTAWSQYPPAFYPGPSPGGYKTNALIAANTSPGVTQFNGQILSVWCGTNGVVQSMLQAAVTDESNMIYTSTIPCTGNGGTGRISVAAFNGKAYAIGQPLNNGSWRNFTMISSTDGINWTYSAANVTCGVGQDTSLAWGFGLNTFTPPNGPQELILAYSTTCGGGVGGFSVASSTDGVNFTWKAMVSSNLIYEETSPWFQSPAVFYWSPLEGAPGNGALYVSYFTTGGYAVVAQSADGVNWSSQDVTYGPHLNRDVMLFSHNLALWYGGQSYYSSDNLWLIGSYDGVNWGSGSQPVSYEYGGIMSTSPSAIDFNGDFYSVWRSCCGNNMWGNYSY